MNSFNRVCLRHVVGNTVVRSAGMASNRRTREVAYLAGGVIVVCDPDTGRQTRFLAPLERLVTAKPRGLSCLAFSHDGTVLAAGERGRYPCVHVWTNYSNSANPHSSNSNNLGHEVHHYLRGEHRSGISCLAISPCNRYLVSVGGRGDYIVLWSLDSNTVLFKRALERSNLIHCVAFAQDDTFFVTAGPRNLCYWSILLTPTAATISPAPVALPGAHGEAVFVDVACGPDGRVYAAAHSRILYVFDRGGRMSRWVNLNAKIYALALTARCLACACADGAVYLFDPDTLACHGMLPRPHPLGTTVINGTVVAPPAATTSPARYPDVVACVLVQSGNDDGGKSGKSDKSGSGNNNNSDGYGGTGTTTVVCAYSDKSMHFWPVNGDGDGGDGDGTHNAFVAHSKAVVDIALVPDSSGRTLLATTSSDGTLRFLLVGDSGVETLHLIPQSAPATESNDNNHDSDHNSDTGITDTCAHQVVPSYDCLDFSQQASILAGSDEHGARSLAARADGRHLALGGRRGRLCVIDVPTLQPIVDIAAAHAAEIVSLDYSRPSSSSQGTLSPAAGGGTPLFLATSSNDARIHVFYAGDANGPNVPYRRIHTIYNHRTPVTSVKFFGGTRLLACSVSGSVIAAAVEVVVVPAGASGSGGGDNTGGNTFVVNTLYNVRLPLAPVDAGAMCGPGGNDDLDVSVFAGVNSNECVFSLAVIADPTLRHAVVGTSSEICVVDTATGRAEISHKADEDMHCFAFCDADSGGSGGSGNCGCGNGCCGTATGTSRSLLSSVGPLVKVEGDPSGMLFATSNGDKIVRLYDLHTGVVREKVAGHGDFVSALKFTPDCKRLITASADSCVFVWDIAPDLVAEMKARMEELTLSNPGHDSSPSLFSSLPLSSSSSSLLSQGSCDFKRLLGLEMDDNGDDENGNGNENDGVGLGQKGGEDGCDEWMASTDVTMVPARVWEEEEEEEEEGGKEGENGGLIKDGDGDISIILRSGDGSDDDNDGDDGNMVGGERSLLEMSLRSLKTPPNKDNVMMKDELIKNDNKLNNDKFMTESIEKAQDAVDRLLELARNAQGTNLEGAIADALRSIQSGICQKFNQTPK